MGVNVNLDRTRRHGIELEASTRLSKSLTLSAVLQHVSAEFTSGPNDGKELVLVPENIATVRLSRSEEHTSELQSLMRISYAVFCLKKKTQTNQHLLQLFKLMRQIHNKTKSHG